MPVWQGIEDTQPGTVAKPRVTGLSPASGLPAGSTSVTIAGTGFTGATGVKFGTAPATSVVVVSATQITCVSPAGTGVVDVTVTTPVGTSGKRSADLFTYAAAGVPVVESVSPNLGSQAGNTAVTLAGTNFTGTTGVTIGGVAATSVVVVNSTTITCVTAAHAIGVVDVLVTNGSGTSAVSALDQYTYVTAPTPKITGLSPNSGAAAGNDLVTISGTDFLAGATVAFGPNPATSVTVVNSTTITCRSPTHAAGTVDVRVTTTSGTSARVGVDHFTYNAPVGAPTVTAVSPLSGPPAGLNTVTLTGTNFTGATGVSFGANPATSVVVVSPTQITCTVPAGTIGVVDVTVTTPSGTSGTSGADQYVYTPSGQPFVTSVSPTSGPVAGGTPLTITGVNFTGATVVFFNPKGGFNFVPATVVSDTQITCVSSPSGSGTGDCDLQVLKPGSRSPVTPGDLFTYTTTVVGTPTRSLKAVSFANEPGGPSNLTTDMAPLYDIFVIQPNQVPAGGLAAFRAANPGNPSAGQAAVAVIQYLNGSHETGYDRPGATQRFGTYTPPSTWFLYNKSGQKILNGANALMFPPSTASDGHGHAGWAAWRAHATAVIAADPAGYDGVMFDTMGKGGFMGGPIDPRTGLTYAVGTYCTEQAAAAAAMFAGWPGTPPHKYMVANGMNHAARYFDSGSAGPSSVLLAKPVYAAIAEQWLKPPSDDNITWPGVSGNPSGTYLQNVNMIADVTQTKGCWFYGIIRMESTTNRTALNMDYWQRIAIACALLGGNGYDSVAIQFEIHTGDTADYPFVRCSIGQPTAVADLTDTHVWVRDFDGPGKVALNTDNTTDRALPTPLPGGPSATWVDVGPTIAGSPGGTTYHGGDTPTVPAHSALILARTA